MKYCYLTLVLVGFFGVRTCAAVAQASPGQPDAGSAAAGRGMQLLQQGRPSEAAAEFRAAVRLHPDFVAAHLGLGEALRAMGDLKGAIVEFKAAVDLVPTVPGPAMQLATTYFQLNQLTSALEWLHRTERLSDDPAQALNLEAAILAQQHRYTEAKSCYLRAIGYEPLSTALHSGLGQLFAEMPNFAAAEDELNAALRIDPAAEQPREILSGILSTEKKYRPAVDTALRGLKFHPQSIGLAVAAADAYEGLGERVQSEQLYKAVLASSPTLATVWGNLGWTQYGAGHFDDAMASSRKALTLDSTLSYVKFNIGLILAVLGKAQEAKQAYLDALKTPTQAETGAAIDDLQNALKRSPQSVVIKESLNILRGAYRGSARLKPTVKAGN